MARPGFLRLVGMGYALLACLAGGATLSLDAGDGLEIRESEKITPEDRDYWAFRPLSPPSIPMTRSPADVRTPLDAMVLDRLEDAGLGFSPEADRRTLVRRVFFDLIGLPPSPDEVARFLAEEHPDAFERLVERLLSSHHFGERWGRHWLDVAGYVDVFGADENAPTIRKAQNKWLYRDYVIKNFNEDRPVDRFFVEQIAGDELVDWRGADSMTPAMKELLVATGFLRMAKDDTDQDVLNIPSNRYQVIFDTMEMFGSSVFGLSFQCARCHSHKFDPIPQRDYFELMSLLTPAYNPTKWLKWDQRQLPAVSQPERGRIDQHNGALMVSAHALEAQVEALHESYRDRLFHEKLGKLPNEIHGDLRTAFGLTEKQRNAVQQFLVVRFKTRLEVKPEEVRKILSEEDRQKTDALLEESQSFRSRLHHFQIVQAMFDMGPPPDTHILIRGAIEAPGEVVKPGFLDVLCDSADEEESFLRDAHAAGSTSGRRLALARWITRPDTRASALVKRVFVNRVWQHLLGKGLVATAGNLGKGSRVSHPRVLELLASEFQRNSWRVKPVIWSIVTSRVYRQASRRANELEESRANEIDPNNRLLWRARLRRVESEVLRDAILVTSGILDRTVGGPPVEVGLDKDQRTYVPKEGQATPSSFARRAVYLLGRRSFPVTLLRAFDQPVMAMNCHQRESSSVVLQSLALLNDDFVLEQADEFARRVQHEQPWSGEIDESTRRRWIKSAFEIAYSRPVSDEEMAWSTDHLQKQATAYRQAGVAEDAIERQALASLCHALINASNFIYAE
jgi:hypothetical protein